MKTVLAPNAPWPGKKPAPTTRKRVHKRKPGSRQSEIDAKFTEWLARNGGPA